MQYSRNRITRTVKGPMNLFVLAGFSSYRGSSYPVSTVSALRFLFNFMLVFLLKPQFSKLLVFFYLCFNKFPVKTLSVTLKP